MNVFKWRSVYKLLKKFLLQDVHQLFQKTEWNIRRGFLNSNPCISVSKKAYVKKTASLQLSPQGRYYGGNIRIAANSLISDGVIIAPYGGFIDVDKNVFIGPYTVVYGHGGIKIGKNTLIAAHCVLIPNNHGFSDLTMPINKQKCSSIGIQIGDDVWLGCGVRVLDGVQIGNGCVVGAGAVVNKSLPSHTIAVGVPAKVVGKRGISNNHDSIMAESLFATEL